MDSSILRKWNGRTIRQRADGYFCLTDMATACDKLVGNWTRLETTKSYLTKLAAFIQIRIDELIQVNVGGFAEEVGTWAHRKAAIRFAQWCDDDFAIAVDTWIEELFSTGSVHLGDRPPIPKILTPEFKAAEEHITYATEQYKFWTEQRNVRMQAMWETRIFQCSDVYLALVSENQPTANGQAIANTGNIKYEGAVDVVIRLGLPWKSKFESALGRHCSEHLQDFKVFVDEEQLNDYQTSQASNKRIPAAMYKAFCPEVEQVVKDFCDKMQARQWMTVNEYKAWTRKQKSAS